MQASIVRKASQFAKTAITDAALRAGVPSPPWLSMPPMLRTVSWRRAHSWREARSASGRTAVFGARCRSIAGSPLAPPDAPVRQHGESIGDHARCPSSSAVEWMLIGPQRGAARFPDRLATCRRAPTCAARCSETLGCVRVGRRRRLRGNPVPRGGSAAPRRGADRRTVLRAPRNVRFATHVGRFRRGLLYLALTSALSRYAISSQTRSPEPARVKEFLLRDAQTPGELLEL